MPTRFINNGIELQPDDPPVNLSKVWQSYNRLYHRDHHVIRKLVGGFFGPLPKDAPHGMNIASEIEQHLDAELPEFSCAMNGLRQACGSVVGYGVRWLQHGNGERIVTDEDVACANGSGPLVATCPTTLYAKEGVVVGSQVGAGRFGGLNAWLRIIGHPNEKAIDFNLAEMCHINFIAQEELTDHLLIV